MKAKALIALLLLLALASCAEAEDADTVATPSIAVEGDALVSSILPYPARRFVDHQYGVVCYIYRVSNISCVKIGEEQ